MSEQARRAHVRVRREFAMRYRLPWGGGWRSVQTRDISAGGLSFVVPRSYLIPGIRVEVEVEFPIAGIKTVARVARTRRTRAGREIGIAFTKLEAGIQDSLGRYAWLCARTA